MGKRSWWQRSLNRHFRLLEAKSARAVEQRRSIEEKRIKAQKERTMEQQEKAFERAHEAKTRGEAVTGADALGRKKTAKELTWRAKWSTRRAKFDTRTRKFS
jgi:hypothetical protein